LTLNPSVARPTAIPLRGQALCRPDKGTGAGAFAAPRRNLGQAEELP